MVLLNKIGENLNTGFYKDLDTNFELACKMSEQDFTHEELISMLQIGNIPEKQIAALKITKIKNSDEAKILMNNLTGCDGKIREAVALKINQLLNQDNKIKRLFISESSPKTFADAPIDINGNICRLVIDSVLILKQDENFSKKYLKYILNFIQETFKELDKFIFRDKKYVINKQLFKLYWCLETLRFFCNEIEIDSLLCILDRASKEKEYTIREKVAQILVKNNNKRLDKLRNQLAQDENYYVRAVFNS